MNFSRLIQNTRVILSAATQNYIKQENYRNFSMLSSSSSWGSWGMILSKIKPLQVISLRGLKQKGVLRRRCKDCYLVVREERSYIMCPTHHRHKQMSIIKKDRTIFTNYAVQSKNRAW